MKLRFNPEAKVTEYMNGPLYFKNEGDPIDVTPPQAEVLLRAVHSIGPEEFVNTFVLAEDQGKVTKEVKVEKASTFPDGFPHADLLTKAGFELEAVRLLSDEDLTNIEGIGPKSAEAVRAALEEK